MSVTTSVEAGPPVGLGLAWLARLWWIPLLGLLAGAGAGVLAGQVLTPTYLAQTSVLVNSIDDTVVTGRTNSGINLDTEAQLVKSAVTAAAAKTLMKSTQSLEVLAAEVNVNVPPNTQVLNIGYSSDSPALARLGSHSFAQAYLDQRRVKAQNALNAEVSALLKQQAALSDTLTKLSGQLVTLPSNSVERRKAEAQVAITQSQLSSLASRLSPLQAQGVAAGSIISDAQTPTRPVSPNVLLLVVSGAAAGALLGLLIALLTDRLSKRIRTARDVTRRTGLPVVADLGKDLTEVINPDSASGRSMMRMAILVASAHRTSTWRINVLLPPPLLVVPVERTGGAVVASNLAQALSAAGTRTHLVGVDLTLPAPAPEPVGPGELTTEELAGLNGPELEEVISARDLGGSLVVLAASSLRTSTSAHLVAGLCRSVVLVVRAHVTRADELADSVQTLENLGVDHIGVVLLRGAGSAPQTGQGGRRSKKARPPKARDGSSTENDWAALVADRPK